MRSADDGGVQKQADDGGVQKQTERGGFVFAAVFPNRLSKDSVFPFQQKSIFS